MYVTILLFNGIFVPSLFFWLFNSEVNISFWAAEITFVFSAFMLLILGGTPAVDLNHQGTQFCLKTFTV